MVPQRWQSLQVHLDAVADLDTRAHLDKADELRHSDPSLAASFEQVVAHMRAAQAEGFLDPSQAAAGHLQLSLAGQVIEGYTLVEPIAEGGMGQVWLARKGAAQATRTVAIKLLARSAMSPLHQQRFQREAQTLASLRHPHIAKFISAGVSGWTQPYLVMEHVPGQPIDKGMDALRLGLRERIEHFLKLLDAVQHAHQHLVVHRDIKPSNVLFSEAGEVKLLDFGIAKLLSDEDLAVTVTARANAMLTPGYAAPEQWLAQTVTTATDVYALGVLLYVLLTGQHPYGQAADSAKSLELATLQKEPTRLSAAPIDHPAAQCRSTSATVLRQQLRGDLERVVSKALHRDAQLRYSQAADFANDLRRYLEHRPVRARPPSWHYLLAKFSRRHRLGLSLGVAASVALAGLGTHAVQQRQQAQFNASRVATIDGLLHSMFRGMSPDVAAQRQFTARELLGRVEHHINHSKEADAGVRTAVQTRLADVYVEVGAYEAAAATLRAAAEGAEKAGEVNAQMEALHRLADAHIKQHQVKEADEALTRLEALLARRPEQADQAHTLALMLRGEWHWQKVQYPQADALLAQAYQRASGQSEAPPASLEVQARILHVRGMLANFLGRPKVAMDLLTQADNLQARRGESGVTDRVNMVRDFARAELTLGRFEAASKRLEPALAEMDARLGPDHSISNDAAAVLLTAVLRQGEFEKASALATRLLQRAGPRREGMTSFARQAQMRIGMYTGDSRSAEPFLRQLVAEETKRLGGPNTYTEPLRRLHGEALLRLDRNEEALIVLQRTQNNQTDLSHARHSTVAMTQVLLGCAMARAGQRQAALTLWKQAHEVLLHELGEQHPAALVAQAYVTLGQAWSSTPEPERIRLIARVERELGWQHGALQLAQWLRADAPATSTLAWSRLPVVF